MNVPTDDRDDGDGWGGRDEGVRRIDDCIEELSSEPPNDSEDERRSWR